MENGPTAIMPGSCKNKKLFPTYVKLMNDKSTTVLDNKVYENLYGVKYSGKSIITIEEGSGMILLKRNKRDMIP